MPRIEVRDTNRRNATRPEGYETYLTVLRGHWSTLRSRYGIKRIGIFGSAVRGEEKMTSDIDVLVEYEEVPDLLDLINLENRLEELLGRKVDLVEKNGVRPELKDRILREVVFL